MTTRAEKAMITRGATAGIVGPILFVLVAVVAGLVFEGHSHLDDKISDLTSVETQPAVPVGS